MSNALEGTLRTRASPGSATRLARWVGGWLLVALGVAAAAGAVRVHRFDASLPEVVDGAPPALGPDVGDDLPFEPFTVAVIDAPSGDHATLDRALQHARDAGAGVMVVLGDVIPTSSRCLAPLADVLLRHPGSVLLARHDDRVPADVDERLTALLLPPQGWDIFTHGCTLRGDHGAVTVRSPKADYEWLISMPDDALDDARVDLLHVRAVDHAERVSAVIEREATASALTRDICLESLWPIAGTTAGLSAVLCGAFISALIGLRLARSPAVRDMTAP